MKPAHVRTVLGYALAVAGFVALLLAPPAPVGAIASPFFQEIPR